MKIDAALMFDPLRNGALAGLYCYLSLEGFAPA